MIRLGCFGELNRMNRKGVAGKIITSFPVMILVFFIIAIYIISAAVLYKVKGAPSSLAIEGVELDNILLKEIVIGDGGSSRRELIFDGFSKESLFEEEKRKIFSKMQAGFDNAEEESKAKERIAEIVAYGQKLRENIKKELLQINKKEYDNSGKQCFIVFLDRGEAGLNNWQSARDMYLIVGNGDIKNGDVSELEKYYNAGLFAELLLPLKFEGKEIEFFMQYYYGKCLEEGV